MRNITIAPAVMAGLRRDKITAGKIIDAIDRAPKVMTEVVPERLTGRRALRCFVDGYRVLYLEDEDEITVVGVRPTVRRRWDALFDGDRASDSSRRP